MMLRVAGSSVSMSEEDDYDASMSSSGAVAPRDFKGFTRLSKTHKKSPEQDRTSSRDMNSIFQSMNAHKIVFSNSFTSGS